MTNNETTPWSNITMINNASVQLRENISFFPDHVGNEADDENVVFPPNPYDSQLETLQTLARSLQTNVAPVVTCVGILTNVACLVLISRQPFLSVSASHYVIGILTSDMLHLGYILHNWINELGLDLFFVGGWCQFVTFTRSFSDFLGIWFMVALLVDRFICVTHPAYEARMCTPWRARLVVVAICITGTVVYLNTSLTVGVFYMGTRPICATLATFTQTAQRLDQADVVINVLLPYTGLAAIGVAITFELLWRRVMESSTETCCSCVKKPPDGAMDSNQRRPSVVNVADINLDFTWTCVWLEVIFLLLTLPYQALRVKDAVTLLIDPARPMALQSFLYQQVLLYLKYLKVTLNPLIIFVSQRHMRHLLTQGCRRGQCRCPARVQNASWDTRGVRRSPRMRPDNIIENAQTEELSIV